MRVHVIVAVAENGVIGREGRMAWRIPEDLKRFRRLTTPHPIIMGRKTWASIGKALPERENVVITRQKAFAAPGAVVVHSLGEALDHARARGATDAFVIGGGEIYREALPLADVLHVTHVHARVEGDATFPPIEATRWRETAREEREQADPQPLRYAFVTYERR